MLQRCAQKMEHGLSVHIQILHTQILQGVLKEIIL
jgi:hypothetical protein